MKERRGLPALSLALIPPFEDDADRVRKIAGAMVRILFI